MFIEKPDDLKMWLTSHLQPLCDADPAALSKYVLALIKKDKTEAELRDSMCQQMDVFLQSETQDFVDKLFSVVDSKEYITQTQIKEDDHSDTGSVEDSRVEDKEPKIEADSTTPSRDDERYHDSRPNFEEERPRLSPPYSRRSTNRLGPRESREPFKKFRSRSNSRELSPRHDRFRSARRRSPSPIYGRRSSDVSRRTRSVEREIHNSRNNTPTRDEGATGYTPTVKKIRCRDYDEKGFCLRGDLCKFDHGYDAVVLEDSTKAAGYQPAGHSEPYVPGLPVGGIPFPPPVLSVPPPGYNQARGKRSYEGGFEPPAKRFDYPRVTRGRGRGRGWVGRNGRGATMLAVRNIPGELNTITHLNGHFCRYGSLVNIQVQFEGDPGSALVTFSSHEEASAAFATSEAVMNNRFIKVFWHQMDKGNVKDRLGKQHQVNANTVVIGEENEVREESKEVKKEPDDSERLRVEKAQAIFAIQKNQEKLQTQQSMMKKVEEKRKYALVKQEELLKSKHDLLDGLIEQQKALIVKLEKGRGIIKAEEKSKIMKLLKDLSSSIDRTKEDIKTSLSVNRNAADIQKDLLDAEIELFALQQEGTEANDLQSKVNNLRMEAAKAGLVPAGYQSTRGRGFKRGRGRGYHQYISRGAMSYGGGVRGRGRGRGFCTGSTNLDRRPSSIQVSGYEIENKEEILNIFNKFGELVETIEDEATPSLIMKYKTRQQAEAAMAEGKNLHEKKFILSWYNKVQGNDMDKAVPEAGDIQDEEEDDGYTPPQEDYLPPGLQEHEDSLGHASKDDNAEELNETGDGSEIFNDELLDEDDEDGDEERSWKRRSNDDD